MRKRFPILLPLFLPVILALLPACAGAPGGDSIAEATPGVPVALRVAPDPATPFDDRLPAQPKKTPHPPVPWAFDVLHYGIDIALDLEHGRVAGEVTVRVRDLEDGVDVLPLHAEEMEIQTVVDRDGGAVAFVHQDGELRLSLPGASKTGTEREFRISYAATPARGLHFLAAPAGHAEFGRQVWSQGECEDTRYWLPCHDAPDDRATHSMNVRVPDAMTVTCAGERVGVTENGDGTATWNFDMATPHVSYLITVVAGDLVVRTDDSGAVPLEFVASRAQADDAVSSLRRTQDVLAFLGRITGEPYPYPRYAQSCVRDFVFGGMENISATTLTDTTLHPRSHEPLKSSDGLVAHEAVHQWFGDLLTCAHWSHVWLNEGFATYFTQLWREHDQGRDAFLVAIRGTMNGALGASEKARRPVISDVYARPFDLFFDGHAYGGGAARLHALRVELGDETFFKAIRLYVARHKEKVVTTEDFESAVSEAAGADMSWFFDQWFRKPGRPKLKVRWKWEADAGALQVTVEQTQTEKKFPQVYRLTLDLVADLADGTSAPQRRLRIDKRKQTFTVPLTAKPLRVRLDPDRGLLARLDVKRPFKKWVELATLDPSPAGRLDALAEVAKVARRKKDSPRRSLARRLLSRVVADDPRFEVRKSAVGELKKLRQPWSAELLAARAINDPDLRVRRDAINALGELDGDAVALRALEALAFDSPAALRPAALRSFAKINGKRAYELLISAVQTPGWQSQIRAAALNGLADVGDERAFATLVRYAAPGSDPWTRDEALNALGRMGTARAEYTEAVLAHLNDPRRAVREAAAKALAKLADPGAVPALMDAYRAARWPRARNTLRNAIIACRKAAVKSGRLVTVEAVRAAGIRAEHADAREGGDKQRAAALKKQLDELGVPPFPKPK